MEGPSTKRKVDDNINDDVPEPPLTVMVMVSQCEAMPPTFYWTDAPLNEEQIAALSGSTPTTRGDLEITIPGYNQEEDIFEEPWHCQSVNWDSRNKKKCAPVINLMRPVGNMIHAIMDE
jgi:hypothetical protein